MANSQPIDKPYLDKFDHLKQKKNVKFNIEE